MITRSGCIAVAVALAEAGIARDGADCGLGAGSDRCARQGSLLRTIHLRTAHQSDAGKE